MARLTRFYHADAWRTLRKTGRNAGPARREPNATVARVFSWIPFASPTMMMLRIPLAEVPVVDIVGSIVVLILSVPVIVWAGGKVFRMGLLMYGKRPAVKEVWKALREA